MAQTASAQDSAQVGEVGDVLAWRRLQAAGLAAVSIGLALVLVVTMTPIPPVIVFCLLFAVMAAAVWRWPAKRWVAIVTGVLAVLALLGNLPFLMEDLAHPETASGFISGMLSVLGALVIVIALVGSLVRADAGLARRVGMGAAGVAALGIVASLALNLTAESASAQDGDVVVVAERAEYPETLEASAGQVAFLIDNNDLYRHTFVIEGQDVHVELPGGKTRRVEVDLAAGEYRYICNVPGHEAMEGTLTVR